MNMELFVIGTVLCVMGSSVLSMYTLIELGKIKRAASQLRNNSDE